MLQLLTPVSEVANFSPGISLCGEAVSEKLEGVMQTKRCPQCETELPTTNFGPNASKKDGLQPVCVVCRRRYFSQWRRKNPAARNSIDRWNKKNKAAIRAYICEYLELHPCVDCGERDPIVLEFDHRPEEEKTFNIGDAIGRKLSVKSVADEISKCDVRCANCHRRVTYQRSGRSHHG